MNAGKEVSPTVAASDLDMNYSTAKKYCKKLADMGLVRRREAGKVTFYSNLDVPYRQLPYASSTVKGTSFSPELLKRFHNERFVALVRESSERFWTQLQRGNWTVHTLRKDINQRFYQSRKEYADWWATFQVHPNRQGWASIVLMVSEYETTTLVDGERVILERVLQAFSWIAKKYRLFISVLNFQFRKTHEHIATVGDPFSTYALSKGWKYKDDVLSFDASKGVPETDKHDPHHALPDSEFFGRMISNLIRTRIDPSEEIPQVKDDVREILEIVREVNTALREEVDTTGLLVILQKLKNGIPKEAKEQEKKDLWRMFG